MGGAPRYRFRGSAGTGGGETSAPGIHRSCRLLIEVEGLWGTAIDAARRCEEIGAGVEDRGMEG
jgi:hypothetical protein